jgi:HAD superfamily hydrolase (TIGR01484 family)
MVKLVVIDFDGTLKPYGEACVSPNVIKYIDSAIEKGITVAVSSGRTYSELIAFLPQLKEKIYFICSDGAYYIKNGKTLYERAIALSDLTLFSSEQNGSFIFHGAQKNYALRVLPNQAERFETVKISRVADIKEKIFKVTSYSGALRLPVYCGLRIHWDGGVNENVQYVNRFCDKGTALSDLQMRLMITKFETVCIGDSKNDIAMMHNAKRSFCVGLRSNELAEVCTDAVLSVEDAFEIILN